MRIFVYFYVFLENFQLKDNFWTSGTNQGALSEVNYGWCGDMTLFRKNESLWAPKEPNNIWNDRCAVLVWKNTTLEDIFLVDNLCSNEIGLFCEL